MQFLSHIPDIDILQSRFRSQDGAQVYDLSTTLQMD